MAQSIGLKKPLKSENLILGVKETFYLDREKIKQRFGLIGNQGLLCEYFGGLFEDENQKYPFAMGFLYTFENHIALGVGINLEDLKKHAKEKGLEKSVCFTDYMDGNDLIYLYKIL